MNGSLEKAIKIIVQVAQPDKIILRGYALDSTTPNILVTFKSVYL